MNERIYAQHFVCHGEHNTVYTAQQSCIVKRSDKKSRRAKQQLVCTYTKLKAKNGLLPTFAACSLKPRTINELTVCIELGGRIKSDEVFVGVEHATNIRLLRLMAEFRR